MCFCRWIVGRKINTKNVCSVCEQKSINQVLVSTEFKTPLFCREKDTMFEKQREALAFYYLFTWEVKSYCKALNQSPSGFWQNSMCHLGLKAPPPFPEVHSVLFSVLTIAWPTALPTFPENCSHLGVPEVCCHQGLPTTCCHLKLVISGEGHFATDKFC